MWKRARFVRTVVVAWWRCGGSGGAVTVAAVVVTELRSEDVSIQAQMIDDR